MSFLWNTLLCIFESPSTRFSPSWSSREATAPHKGRLQEECLKSHPTEDSCPSRRVAVDSRLPLGCSGSSHPYGLVAFFGLPWMWLCQDVQGLRLLAREEAACLSVLTGDGDVPGYTRTALWAEEQRNKEREREIWPCEGGYPALRQPRLHNHDSGHS